MQRAFWFVRSAGVGSLARLVLIRLVSVATGAFAAANAAKASSTGAAASATLAQH